MYAIVHIVDHLAALGFDVLHRFDLRAFPDLPLPRLPVGILIGNTRALWPTFLATADLALPDPLDRYVERALDPFAPVYVHRRYGGTWLPFRRIAIVTGLGAESPCGLLVHPIYGQWFALRAIIATDGEPPITAPIAKPCSCTSACDPPWTGAQRGACSVGREHAYTDEQRAYHDTKDRRYLYKCSPQE